MSPSTIGIGSLVLTFSCVLLGMRLRKLLPEHYLSQESQDTVKVGTGLIATMSALVLGLITASAKSSFDEMDAAVTQTAIQMLTLDRLLARLGTDTHEVRQGLRRALSSRVMVIWQPTSQAAAAVTANPETFFETERLADQIRNLQSHGESGRALQTKAVDLAEVLLQSRWLSVAGIRPSVPVPFLAILLFWLGFTFASFGLLAPRNALVLGVLFVCALSVGSAIFLILEMDSPFSGLICVSDEPLRQALDFMTQ